jgi:hypothetical protein
MKTQILTAIGETGLQREVGLNACGIDDPILDTVVAGSAHGWEIMPRAWRQTHLCTHRRRYAGDGRPGSRREPGWLCGTVRWITETPAEALELLEGIDLDAVVRTSFAPPVPETLAVAQVGGMGVASGAVALDSDAVKRLSQAGSQAIMVRRETTTTDIEGMALSAGILTASGGVLRTRRW